MSARLVLPLIILIVVVASLIYDYLKTKNRMTDDQIKSVIQANGIKNNYQEKQS